MSNLFRIITLFVVYAIKNITIMLHCFTTSEQSNIRTKNCNGSKFHFLLLIDFFELLGIKGYHGYTVLFSEVF